MDYTIHGLSKEILAVLGDRAARLGVSKQAYLRRIVILSLTQPEVHDVLRRQEDLMKICASIIRENTETMSRLMNETREGALR